MPPTEIEGLRERARENMRQILRDSGHNFSVADIEKLCDDAQGEINSWADFAALIQQETRKQDLQKLLPYIDHAAGCPFGDSNPDGDFCTCSVQKVIRDLQRME
jgi:hypothetical protein